MNFISKEETITTIDIPSLSGAMVMITVVILTVNNHVSRGALCRFSHALILLELYMYIGIIYMYVCMIYIYIYSLSHWKISLC